MFKIGVDIEDIKRFEKYVHDIGDEFLKLIFTQKELEYCFSYKNPARHLAARFCAKEALVKAVSDLNLKLDYCEIEILNKPNGAPFYVLDENKNLNTSLSLSHDKTKAMAVALVERRKCEF